jgi:hypothetical protein
MLIRPRRYVKIRLFNTQLSDIGRRKHGHADDQFKLILHRKNKLSFHSRKPLDGQEMDGTQYAFSAWNRSCIELLVTNFDALKRINGNH